MTVLHGSDLFEQKEGRNMRVFENLEPKEVFYYFEDICSIPHGSGNTQNISDYCVDFAKEHGLKYRQDVEMSSSGKMPHLGMSRRTRLSCRGIWIWWQSKMRTVRWIWRRMD